MRRDASGVDFGGPFVGGKRGERYFGLRWGTFDAKGTFTVFRAAKLRAEDIDRSLIRSAIYVPGKRLIGRLGLTDDRGWPICASVRPPMIVWSVSPE